MTRGLRGRRGRQMRRPLRPRPTVGLADGGTELRRLVGLSRSDVDDRRRPLMVASRFLREGNGRSGRVVVVGVVPSGGVDVGAGAGGGAGGDSWHRLLLLRRAGGLGNAAAVGGTAPLGLDRLRRPGGGPGEGPPLAAGQGAAGGGAGGLFRWAPPG